MVICIVLSVIILFFIGTKQDKKKKEEKHKEWEEKKLKYKREQDLLFAKYGSPDKEIKLKANDINKEVIVFESANKIILLGKEFDFKDILSCNMTADSRVIGGSEINTNNASMVGRAVVGAALAGPVGGVVGAVTSTKEVRNKTVGVCHDYTIVVYMNSISDPSMKIHVGYNTQATNDIMGVLNVIISRNNNSN